MDPERLDMAASDSCDSHKFDKEEEDKQPPVVGDHCNMQK